VRERKNTLLSFGRAADHAAVAFVEFDVQVYTHGASLRCDY
jgi:glycerophosphodiester phosphodiesterase